MTRWTWAGVLVLAVLPGMVWIALPQSSAPPVVMLSPMERLGRHFDALPPSYLLSYSQWVYPFRVAEIDKGRAHSMGFLEGYFIDRWFSGMPPYLFGMFIELLRAAGCRDIDESNDMLLRGIADDYYDVARDRKLHAGWGWRAGGRRREVMRYRYQLLEVVYFDFLEAVLSALSERDQEALQQFLAAASLRVHRDDPKAE